MKEPIDSVPGFIGYDADRVQSLKPYRQFLQEAETPLLAFRERDVQVEGTMSELIVNPAPLTDHVSVRAAVKAWLTTDFNEPRFDSPFALKWQELSDADRLILRAVVEEGKSQRNRGQREALVTGKRLAFSLLMPRHEP